mgnify:FL=1
MARFTRAFFPRSFDSHLAEEYCYSSSSSRWESSASSWEPLIFDVWNDLRVAAIQLPRSTRITSKSYTKVSSYSSSDSTPASTRLDSVAPALESEPRTSRYCVRLATASVEPTSGSS